MNALRVLRVVLALFAAGAWLQPAQAADIAWRGGFGDNFAEKRNWELPPDMPPDTRPEDRELFRRVPGAFDHAILPAGVTVRVTTAVRVEQATIPGKLVVEGAQALFTSDNPDLGVTDRYGEVEVREGGEATLANAAFFNGPVRVEGRGRLAVAGGALLDKLTLVGSPALPAQPRFTSFAGGSDDQNAVIIRELLELDGESGSVVSLAGFVRVTKEATWRHCRVNAGHVTIGDPASEAGGAARPSQLRLLEGDENTVWLNEAEGRLEFQREARLLHGPGRHIFSGTVVFAEGSPGIPEPPANAGPIIFRSGQQVLRSRALVAGGANPTLELHAPLVFEQNASVHFVTPTPTDAAIAWRISRGPDGGVRAVEFRDNTVVEVAGPVLAQSLVMDGNAKLNIRPGQSFRVRGLDQPALFALRGGSVVLEAGEGAALGRFLVETNGTLRVGHTVPFTGFLAPPAFKGEVTVEEGGRLEFVGPPSSPNRNPIFNGECRVQPGGLMTVEDGYGPSGGRLTVINFGELRVLPPRPAPVEGFRSGAFVAETLINDGFLEVEPGAILEVQEGEHFRNGTISVLEGGTFSVMGRGLNDQLVWRDFTGELKTNRLGRLFNFRAGSRGGVQFAADSRLEVVGNGRYGRAFRNGQLFEEPGGVRLEHRLDVDHVVLGRFDGQIPQIRFGEGEFPEGVGLRIGKRLDWHGGAFVGTGAGINLSTANVELPAGSLAFITRPPEDFGTMGDNYVLHGGITCNVRGGLTINATRALVSEDDSSRFIFHPGADVEIQGMTSQTGMTLARILNRALVRKTSLQRAIFNGLWVNEGDGTLRVDEGEMVIQEGAVSGGHYLTAVTGAAFTLNKATLRDFTQTGGQLTAFRETHFEGNNSVDFLVIGNAISSEVVLTSAADSTLTVKKGMTWRSNGIQLGSNSRVVLAEDAQSIIASALTTSPPGRFESGTLENRGRLTYVANDQSAFQFDGAGRLENNGAVVIDTSKGIRLFQGNLAGRPGGFDFINRGLVLLALVAEGRITAEMAARYVQLENGIIKLLEEQPAQLQGGSPPPGRPARHAPNPPNLGQVIFTDDFEMSGGECDFSNCDVRFNDTVTMTGGKLIGGNNGEVLFNSTYNFNGGELRLEGLALGRFGRITTVRNGRIFLDAEATLDALPGFNLREGSVLSGRGRTTGGVAVIDSIIAPGVNGPNHSGPDAGVLIIGTDVSFNANSRLILDVPLARGAIVTDTLLVGGKATLAGTLQANPLVPATGELADGPILALAFGTVVGDFTTFASMPFRNGLKLDRRLRGAPNNDLILTVAADVSANLALTAETPLTVPTGAEVNHRFTVENLGPDEAPFPSLEVTLPPNAAFVSSTPAGTVAGGKLAVSLGPSLIKDAEATVLVQLKAPDTVASLATSATVSSLRPDPSLENNTVSATTAVLVNGEFKVAKFGLNGAGKLRLTFETLPGVRYRLERSTDLVTWQPHRDFLGDGTAQTADNLGGNGGQPEFFRLVIL